MADADLANPSERPEDHPAVISRNARAGLGLFLLYAAMYAAFLLLNIFAPRVMTDSTIPLGDYELDLGGANLAVGGGIALILIAILLSFVYLRMTRFPPTASHSR